MKNDTVLIDVDTQHDFMDVDGALHVEGAVGIVPNLKRLIDYGRREELPIVATADAHAPDDPEFAEWPPHCVAGTPGQKKIPETTVSDAVTISGKAPETWAAPAYVIEKQDVDPLNEPAFLQALDNLGARKAIVFGVATDVCIRNVALGVREHGMEVTVVSDAVAGIDEEKSKTAMTEMRGAGIEFRTTEQVIGS